MSLEVSFDDRLRLAPVERVEAWLRRNTGATYRRECGEIHSALVEDPGITFSQLAENLGRPCDPAVRGKLVSLAHLRLVFQMDGVWWPFDPDYIAGPYAEVLGG